MIVNNFWICVNGGYREFKKNFENDKSYYYQYFY